MEKAAAANKSVTAIALDVVENTKRGVVNFVGENFTDLKHRVRPPIMSVNSAKPVHKESALIQQHAGLWFAGVCNSGLKAPSA